MLSSAAMSVWAKSPFSRDPAADDSGAWLPLFQHLTDTADVAERLWDEWVPAGLIARLTEAFGDAATARRVYVFLAGVHDIGKASPAFAVQVETLAGAMEEHGLVAESGIAGTEERRLARHEIVGALALADWLGNRHGYPRPAAIALAAVIGGHHGVSHGHERLDFVRKRPQLAGIGLWAHVRVELLDWMSARTGFDAVAAEVARALLPQAEAVILGSLVVMADWIASNDDYFPLAALGQPAPDDLEDRPAKGWRLAALSPRWHVSPPENVDEQFHDRFGFAPNAVQRAFVQKAAQLRGPGLLILEAPMGLGKTEAALAAAEVIAERSGASGVFIGLPTQATSDSMFHRMLGWAGNLPAGISTVFLAHARAELEPEYERLRRQARYGSIAVDDQHERMASLRSGATEHAVQASHWMTDRRRGPLSDLVVGTVDQLLFLALRSRYAGMRHLALAGKIVIVDEAHAYSTYMNAFLDRALHWLGAHGTTVIVLSATLPARRRAELVAAYADGRGRATGAPGRPDVSALATDIGYPAIVSEDDRNAPVVVNPPVERAAVEVTLERLADTDSSLVTLLAEALADGGCAAVIRNTVDRARTTARMLAAAFPGTRVLLAHSRFLAADRSRKDAELLRLFGHPDHADTTRPDRCILVATQVVEQSLDLDFDVMVSDLAPVDLLLQRMGRLHRHHRIRPAPVALPRFAIAGVDWSTEPPEPDRAYRTVYSPSVLLRTLCALHEVNTLRLPEDIASLVQWVYGEAHPDRWEDELAAARTAFDEEGVRKRDHAAPFLIPRVAPPGTALIGWNDLGIEPDERAGRAAVRDSEETLEVIGLWTDASGTLIVPSWIEGLGGEPIPLDAPPSWTLTRAIRGCALRLPAKVCAGRQLDEHITELERRRDELGLRSWFASPQLRGELVLAFDHTGTARLGRHTLRYNRETGLEIVDADGTSHRVVRPDQ